MFLQFQCVSVLGCFCVCEGACVTLRCDPGMRHVFSRIVCRMILIFGEGEDPYLPQI